MEPSPRLPKGRTGKGDGPKAPRAGGGAAPTGRPDREGVALLTGTVVALLMARLPAVMGVTGDDATLLLHVAALMPPVVGGAYWGWRVGVLTGLTASAVILVPDVAVAGAGGLLAAPWWGVPPVVGLVVGMLQAREVELLVQQRVFIDALKESEDSLRLLAEAADEGVVIHQRGGVSWRILTVNQAYGRMIGYEPSELIGRTSLEFVAPEDRPKFTKAIGACSGAVVEFRLLHRDGTILTVEGAGRTTVHRGRTLRIAAVRDVTARKKAHADLKALSQWHDLLLRSVSDGIIGLDQGGGITFANPAACQILGFELVELVGQDHHRGLLQPLAEGRTYPSEESPIHRTLSAGVAVKDAEGTFWSKAGTGLTVEYSCTPVVEGDRPAGAVVTFRDISRRKRAEEALAREHHQLQEVVTAAPVAMAMLDGELRYLAHGRQWLEEWGLRGKDIIGKPHLGLFKADSERWQKRFDLVLQGMEQEGNEDLLHDPGGAAHHIRWALQPWYTAEDRLGGVIVVTSSVDALVRAREAAIEASRIKTEILSNTTHELRTPLNSIIGFTRLVLKQPEARAVPRIEANLQIVLRNSEHLLKQIDLLLDHSRIETGQIALHPEAFDLRALSAEVAVSLGPLATEKGLSLIAVAGEVEVFTDQEKVRRILVNLVGNSLKFTTTGGVTIECTQQDEVEVCVHVIDTGVGIPPDQLERIFEPFVQVDATLSRRGGGAGLGLAISRQLARTLGGSLSVTSEVGRGADFALRLPRVLPGQASNPLQGWRSHGPEGDLSPVPNGST